MWGKLVEALADVGYDSNNLVGGWSCRNHDDEQCSLLLLSAFATAVWLHADNINLNYAAT